MLNANRQIGQLRRMEREYGRMLRWAFLFWLVPAVLLVAGILLEWHGLVLALLALAVLSGAIQHGADARRVRSFRQRVVSLEASRDAGT